MSPLQNVCPDSDTSVESSEDLNQEKHFVSLGDMSEIICLLENRIIFVSNSNRKVPCLASVIRCYS